MNTNSASADVPAASARLSRESWLRRLRAAEGYDTAAQLLGSGWFLILAILGGLKLVAVARRLSIDDFSPTGWPALVSSLCLFLFYLALYWLVLRRPTPVARTAGVLPSVTAFAGTYFPWTFGLLAPGAASVKLDILSAALLLIGAVSMVVVIFHLGRCFSIVPQARRLVRSGPYAVVRHPLYLVEEVALLGILLQCYSHATLALFLCHFALQVRRIFYEEDLLRRTFPEYGDYAMSTSRLVPGIW